MNDSTQNQGAGQGWQDEAGRKWVRLERQTDLHLGPLGQGAIDALELKPGESVLDVGCGAGQSLLQLAALVGATGHVYGVDISEPLLERARTRVAEHGYSQVELILADAATHSLSTPVDAIYSRFGVMFFDDCAAAFRNLQRALRRPGRLAFVCWQSLERNPWAHVPLTAVREVAPEQPLPEMFQLGNPGPFYFSDPGFVQRLLEGAGFADVRVSPREQSTTFGGAATVAEGVEFALNIGPAARFVATADASLLPQFRAALEQALVPYLEKDGVRFIARTHIVTARNG